MGLMESGCTRRDFGRDVQPAIPNRPRCWSLVGSMFGAISKLRILLYAASNLFSARIVFFLGTAWFVSRDRLFFEIFSRGPAGWGCYGRVLPVGAYDG